MSITRKTDRGKRVVKDAAAHAAFVERLQMLVAERGASLSLAQAIGVPNNTLHAWLHGSEPGRDNLIKVARATGVSISWLAVGEGEMRPNRPPQGYALPLWSVHIGPGAQRWGEPPPLAFSERLWNRIYGRILPGTAAAAPNSNRCWGQLLPRRRY